MKKWIALAVAVLLAIAAYVGAGPYLTVRAIRTAVKEQDTAALTKQIDFPALRASLKAQMIDAMVREAGADVQANPIGAFALTMATSVVNGAVDAMVTPIGLAGVMEGRRLWRNTRDSFSRPQVDANGEPLPVPNRCMTRVTVTNRCRASPRRSKTIPASPSCSCCGARACNGNWSTSAFR